VPVESPCGTKHGLYIHGYWGHTSGIRQRTGPQALSAEERKIVNTAEIMESANHRGLTVAGIRVRVIGAGLEYAKVVIAQRDHPLFGWWQEYAWEAIAQATDGAGTLS